MGQESRDNELEVLEDENIKEKKCFRTAHMVLIYDDGFKSHSYIKLLKLISEYIFKCAAYSMLYINRAI